MESFRLSHEDSHSFICHLSHSDWRCEYIKLISCNWRLLFRVQRICVVAYSCIVAPNPVLATLKTTTKTKTKTKNKKNRHSFSHSLSNLYVYNWDRFSNFQSCFGLMNRTRARSRLLRTCNWFSKQFYSSLLRIWQSFSCKAMFTHVSNCKKQQH